MAHRGRQNGQLGLDVDPCSIPPQQSVHSMRVTQIVSVRGLAGRIADTGALK